MFLDNPSIYKYSYVWYQRSLNDMFKCRHDVSTMHIFTFTTPQAPLTETENGLKVAHPIFTQI